MVTEKQVYEGLCIGGPMGGQRGESRYAAGFVLIDRPGRRVWLYDRRSGSVEGQPPSADDFRVREAEGRELDDDARWAAGESGEWDVRALDGSVPDDVERGL